ncbi:MAG: YdcF family protein [Clostridia bacterium]|nr:YdcF family protein [Clostridia bacterium]
MKKKAPWWKAALLTLFYVVLIGVLLVAAAFTGIVIGEKKVTDPYDVGDSDVIIILGAAVHGDTASPTLACRLEKGYELFEQNHASNFILCGGQGEGEDISEAQCMKNMLLEYGVPAPNIYLDETSTDTWQNLTNAKAIMEENGFDHCIIVTSDYHLLRAYATAKVFDMKFEGAAAKTIWPGILWKMRLREILAWGKFALQYLHIL